MKNDLYINDHITIPDHELEISASRAGGPGGQHVNKTSTKITVRWNLENSMVLHEEEKNRIRAKIPSQITAEGDILVHNSTSRSQTHNKKEALQQLAHLIRNALIIPKKRMKKKPPKAAKEAWLEYKKQRGEIKKLRQKKVDYD